MMRKMLAATLALGLMTNGASAQFGGSEVKAQKELANARMKEAEAARAQAEQLADEAKKIASEMKQQQAEMQRRIEALEKQLRASRDDANGARKRSTEAVERARTEMRRAIGERAAKGEAAAAGKKEAYIGVVTDKVPEILSSNLGLKGGLVVAQILPDSPASKSDLKANDVLLSMNGTALESPEQFKKLVVSETGGAKASFNVLRAGKKDTIVVVLGEREANRISGFFKGNDEFGKTFKLGEGAKGFEWKSADGPGVEFKFFGKEGEGPGGGEWKTELPGGAKVFGRAKASSDAGGKGADSTSISIQNADGKITIDAAITHDGKTERVKESGTREELLKKLNKFPEKARGNIRQSLEGMEEGGSGKGGKVRVETRVHADAKPVIVDGAKIALNGVDPKALAEIYTLHAADMEKLHEDLDVKVVTGEHLKALKDLKVHLLDAKTGALKELEGLKLDQLKQLESLKGLKELHLERLQGLENLKELDALKNLDVQVRVLGSEDLKGLSDKLPKEIELQIEKSLQDSGLKEKIKDKVIIQRRDSQ